MHRRGIIHVHSKFSYDGRNTLEEIARLGRRRGYGFVGMTEHSDTFDAEKMKRLVDECGRLSDPTFVLMPGIEFTCENNLHLMGIGIERFTEEKDPIRVARFIRMQGGLAVVSHPSRYAYQIPDGLENEVDGIEIWNAGYDGRFVPNDQSMGLLCSLRRSNGALRGFGGQDLHQIENHCHVKIEVSSVDLNRNDILGGLKNGEFMVSNPYVALSSTCEEGWMKRMSISWARRVYLLVREMRNRLVGSRS